MQARTHLKTSESLVGRVVELTDGTARAVLDTTEQMAVDDRGLIHGGFVFGLADYAAMLAVNDPNVVLGSSEVRFLAPVSAGQQVVAIATVKGEKGKKREVDVSASVGSTNVFVGTFTCFVLDQHVLEK